MKIRKILKKRKNGENNVSNSDKSELKQYLSGVYEIDEENIKIN